MKRKTETHFAHLAPDEKHTFITPQELEEAGKLKAKFATLEAHLHSLSAAALTEGYRRARADFLASPNEDNKQILLLAFFKKKFLQEDGTVRSIVREGLTEFHQKYFSPWASRIIGRTLKLAQEKLKAVTAEERQRIRQRTGREMTHSDIVAAAQGVVDELQARLNKVTRPGLGLSIGVDSVLSLFGFADNKDRRRARAEKYLRGTTPRTRKQSPPSEASKPKRRGCSHISRAERKRLAELSAGFLDPQQSTEG